jgi:thiol:disulfide interchange protein
MFQKFQATVSGFLTLLIVAVSLQLVHAQPGGGMNAKSFLRWGYEVKKVSDAEFDLIFKADLSPKWHLYGPYQEYPYGSGPLPLIIEYDSKANFSTVGRLKSSPKAERILDDVFEVYVNQYSGRITFTQRILVNTETPFTIKGSLNGQICLEMCIPFDDDFSFQISGAKVTGQERGVPSDPVPSDEITASKVDEGDGEENTGATAGEDPSKEAAAKGKEKSLLGFFLLALALGIAGIFTPCVFPMIPMNIAFFLNYKGGRTKGKFLAVFYGFSIIFIYSILGLLITVIFGAQAMNDIVSHWLTNVIFFLIFIFFAASFFGAYELVLPAKWVNKADSQVDKGGLIGTFFMALTLVLVSFSCTAAFIGTILVEAADGTSLLKPFVGMLGFSIGFGVPFALLALFPSVMQKMPKSGGWMNAVKVVFGFIILAFGMKFLIIPDQTYHLGLLSRDLYIAIWIVLFSLMGFYLLGKYRFHHDTELKHLGFFRLLLVIATFSFVVYLIPGLFGADLKGISGLLPPKSSQKFTITGTMATAETKESTLCGTPLYSDFLHTPKGTEGYFDLDEAIACAKQQNKPLFIDFTGHSCANCKVMENTVWADPRVMEKFRNDFIIVALYNDDNFTLPEEKWVTNDKGRVLKTIGRVNKHFQQTQFGSVAVPYYVVVDHELNMLSGSWTTDKSIEGFLKFLDNGVQKFKANNN